MKIFLSLLCLTSLGGSGLHAAQTPPAAAIPKKSVFDAADARNPFWPIGWKKPATNGGNASAAPALSPSAFALTSVTTGHGGSFAILNGKIFQQGQQFGLQMGSQIYKVTVQSVQDGEVILSYDGGQVVVPLRRR
ncbi:MAG TPA: hypothetical protein VHW03_01635 [Chthoniobacterales bacterium]|nr:hypothetical protein [Chthoniobacterales bacterium]